MVQASGRLAHHLTADSLFLDRSVLALLVAPKEADWVELPAVPRACRQREELEVNLAAFKDKYPQVDTTGLAHTKEFGGKATTPVKALAKTSMAQTMVTPSAGDIPDTEAANGYCPAAATAVVMATAVATAVFTQLASATAT